MERRFDACVDEPQNQISKVAFFPDRIFHAQHLNAGRSARYRYKIHDVRGKADISLLHGEVYLDGVRLCNVLRIEYRGARLAEAARERGHLLGPKVIAWVALSSVGISAEARLVLHHSPWIGAYQVECWETLEPPHGKRHDYQILDQMGHRGPITCVPHFAHALAGLKASGHVDLAFREDDVLWPDGVAVGEEEVAWDNGFQRSIQVPRSQEPGSGENTLLLRSYGIDLRRGWFIRQVHDIQPVRYRNAMMQSGDAEARLTNIIEIRWILQQEFGGTIVFFHEVTIPPGAVEGTHQHAGSEELYYFVEGNGLAYMGEGDDPALTEAPLVDRSILGLGSWRCREIEVRPGSVIYTKSGGMHGVRNPYDMPLRFVAFLYHTT